MFVNILHLCRFFERVVNANSDVNNPNSLSLIQIYTLYIFLYCGGIEFRGNTFVVEIIL